MNLPTNHRLLTPEELREKGVEKFPNIQWRLKNRDLFQDPWRAYPWPTGPSEDELTGYDFCIPAVRTAEEKGEEWCSRPITMASREVFCGSDILGTFGNETALRIVALLNRPTPAIQQAVEALEKTIEALRYGGIGDDRPYNKLVQLIESERSKFTGDNWDYWNYLSEKLQACKPMCSKALTALRHLNGEVRG